SDAFPNGGDQARERGHSWQQHFFVEQPGCCQVKKHTGSLGADPDARVEKTHQGKSSTTLRKICVASVLPNFLGMILLGLDALGILRDALWIGNPKLGSDIS